jgi:hypothetical protein
MNKSKKIVIIGLISTMVLVLALATPVLADSISSQGAVNNIAPAISSVSLKNGDGSAFSGPADCETEYRVDFTITDDNTLEDLTDVDVEVYYETQTVDAIRSHYTFTWIQGTNSWASSPAGYLDPTNPSTTPASMTGASFAFSLYFKLDGVAIPAGTADKWNVKITATDDSAATDTDTSITPFQLNTYTELSLSSSSLDFGTANPGAAFSSSPTTNATITCNTALLNTFTGANLTKGSDSIAYSQFTIQGGDITVATALTGAAQDIRASGYKATSDSLDASISGYTDGEANTLTFAGTAPTPCPAGTYTGTWTIALSSVETPS